MSGDRAEVNIPLVNDDPVVVEARTALEAALKARGAEVDISYRNKGANQNIQMPANQQAPAPVARPPEVPEKFWDAAKGEVNMAALLKAQADAQAEITRLNQGKPANEGATPPAAATPELNADGTPKAPETPPKSTPETAIASAREEFAKDGKLSDATYTALAAGGITKDMVDGYIASSTAKVTELRSAAFEAAGSETDFNKMSAWAKDNMDAGDIAVLNTLLTSSDAEVVKRGAAQLKARFEKDADIDPAVRLGGGAPPADGSFFKSRHEMVTAMNDPRYKVDASFRKEVEQKILRASKNKVNLMM